MRMISIMGLTKTNVRYMPLPAGLNDKNLNKSCQQLMDGWIGWHSDESLGHFVVRFP